MSIKKNNIVTIHYTLKNDQNRVIDSSEGNPPLVYLHGAKNVIKGMEDALEAKKIGDAFNVVVPPEETKGLAFVGDGTSPHRPCNKVYKPTAIIKRSPCHWPLDLFDKFLLAACEHCIDGNTNLR